MYWYNKEDRKMIQTRSKTESMNEELQVTNTEEFNVSYALCIANAIEECDYLFGAEEDFDDEE